MRPKLARHLWFSFLALLSAFNALAVESADCLKFTFDMEIAQGAPPPKLTPGQYRSHLDQLAKLTQGLKRPEFKLVFTPRDASYRPNSQGKDLIEVYSHLGYRGPNGKAHSPEYEISALDHEIGHGIYETNLTTPHLRLHWINDRLDRTEAKIKELEQKELLLQKTLRETGDLIHRRHLMETQFHLNQGRGFVLALKRSRRVIAAYHELYADLTAVVSRWDPKTVMKITRANYWIDRLHNHSKSYRDLSAIRDFTKEWSRSRQRTFWSLDDEYAFFASARKPIWDSIKNTPSGPERDQLLQRLFKVLSEHERSVFPTESVMLNQGLDPEAINAGVIEAIAREFRKPN